MNWLEKVMESFAFRLVFVACMWLGALGVATAGVITLYRVWDAGDPVRMMLHCSVLLVLGIFGLAFGLALTADIMRD